MRGWYWTGADQTGRSVRHDGRAGPSHFDYNQAVRVFPILRRLSLTMVAAAAVCWCQSGLVESTGASHGSVQTVIPREVWMPVFEVLLAGIVGASGALFGVWMAGRRHTAENAANREHDLEVERRKAEIAARAKSQDARWAFRRDVYVSLSNTITALMENGKTRRNLLKEHREVPETLQQEMLSNFAQLKALANLAPMAIGDSVLPPLRSVQIHASGGEDGERAAEQLHALADLRRLVHQAGRRELWGAEEDPGGGAERPERPL